MTTCDICFVEYNTSDLYNCCTKCHGTLCDKCINIMFTNKINEFICVEDFRCPYCRSQLHENIAKDNNKFKNLLLNLQKEKYEENTILQNYDDTWKVCNEYISKISIFDIIEMMFDHGQFMEVVIA